MQETADIELQILLLLVEVLISNSTLALKKIVIKTMINMCFDPLIN